MHDAAAAAAAAVVVVVLRLLARVQSWLLYGHRNQTCSTGCGCQHSHQGSDQARANKRPPWLCRQGRALHQSLVAVPILPAPKVCTTPTMTAVHPSHCQRPLPTALHRGCLHIINDCIKVTQHVHLSQKGVRLTTEQ